MHIYNNIVLYVNMLIVLWPGNTGIPVVLSLSQHRRKRNKRRCTSSSIDSIHNDQCVLHGVYVLGFFFFGYSIWHSIGLWTFRTPISSWMFVGLGRGFSFFTKKTHVGPLWYMELIHPASHPCSNHHHITRVILRKKKNAPPKLPGSRKVT
ncbi:hypothetical protein HanXRQr2_Chr12g0536611 [Helianthus annuus]|uniref:Uncharacterized protein n=1 Tax=Helianthus annuus TaxID=4232 RepID=A0A9K3MVL8_HELAN|nr:hypothetical protein HanXRQr2_Chr12g0536611 [Helianthus annuus]KAJ0862327.1 hypothetical protein HanPSC8_Chr12g0516881 [Helianthus annuus]